MMLQAMLGEAWRAMGANRLRTVLTMLGMVIGVGSVVLMMAIGQGAQYAVAQTISTMGSNLYVIIAGWTQVSGARTGGGYGFTLRLGDAGGHGGRTVPRGRQVEILPGHGRGFHPQIEAVHQRARDAAQIIFAADGRAGAGAGRIGEVAAFAGIGGGDQQEPAGVADMGIGAGDDHLAGFDGLAQGFKNGARKFGKFVKKQHAIMRQ